VPSISEKILQRKNTILVTSSSSSLNIPIEELLLEDCGGNGNGNGGDDIQNYWGGREEDDGDENESQQFGDDAVSGIVMDDDSWLLELANDGALSIYPSCSNSPGVSISLNAYFLYIMSVMRNSVVDLTRILSQWYLKNMESRPLLTQATSSAVMGFLGDLLAQNVEARMRRRKDFEDDSNLNITYDFRRAFSFFGDGLLISGPLMYGAYNLFERILPVSSATGFMKVIAPLSHVLADTVLMDTFFVFTMFFTSGFFEGRSLDQIVNEVSQDYVPALKAGLGSSTLLIPVEFAIFKYMPLVVRPLAIDMCDIFWTSVTSYMTHRHRVHVQQQAYVL